MEALAQEQAEGGDEPLRRELEAARAQAQEALAELEAQRSRPAETEGDEDLKRLEKALAELEQTRSRLEAAELKRVAAVERAAAVEGHLEALERDRERAGDDWDAAPPQFDEAETSELRRRVSQLEAEVLAGQEHVEALSARLADAQRDTEQAIGRAREEAEARDRAEAEAAGGRRRRTGGAQPDNRTEALQAQLAALEAEAEAARADADRMSTQLLEARRELERASEQLKDEAEARMRAESRAAATAGGSPNP
jgi:hypothetical protein